MSWIRNAACIVGVSFWIVPNGIFGAETPLSAGWPSLLQAWCEAQETSVRTLIQIERSTAQIVNSTFLGPAVPGLYTKAVGPLGGHFVEPFPKTAQL